MIDQYSTQSRTRNSLRNGSVGPLFPAFITALKDRGHTVSSIRRMIRTADRLGRWIQDHGVRLHEANQNHTTYILPNKAVGQTSAGAMGICRSRHAI